MKCELKRGEKICPYCNARHIRRCQEDVDRWRIHEIVEDWWPYQGGKALTDMWGGGLVIDFGMCCCVS